HAAHSADDTPLQAPSAILKVGAEQTEKEQAILALHRQGYTARQIAHQMDLSRQRVYLYLERLGCTPNRGQHPAIVQTHQHDLSPRQIAGTYHSPLRPVYNCLNQRGLTPHQSPAPRATRMAIQNLYQQGQTPQEIARTVGVTVQAVYW